jgi:hypothetical protein
MKPAASNTELQQRTMAHDDTGPASRLRSTASTIDATQVYMAAAHALHANGRLHKGGGPSSWPPVAEMLATAMGWSSFSAQFSFQLHSISSKYVMQVAGIDLRT